MLISNLGRTYVMRHSESVRGSWNRKLKIGRKLGPSVTSS